MYSHLSIKLEVMLTDFEKKIQPPRTFPPSTFIDFLDFFPPSTPCLLQLSHHPSLFQPLRLLILQLLHPLYVFSNLHGY